jgi:hypothetical protein
MRWAVGLEGVRLGDGYVGWPECGLLTAAPGAATAAAD